MHINIETVIESNRTPRKYEDARKDNYESMCARACMVCVMFTSTESLSNNCTKDERVSE